MEDIEYYDIPIYNFPYDVEEDDGDGVGVPQGVLGCACKYLTTEIYFVGWERETACKRP